MVTMRADVADGQRSVDGKPLLNFQTPGFHCRHSQIWLHATGDRFYTGVCGIRSDAREGKIFYRAARVVRTVLTQALAQIIKERVIDSEPPPRPSLSLSQ